MNKEEILGAFSLVNNPIVLSEEEVKDVQKAIKELQQENQELKLELSGYRQAILEDKDMLGLKEENDKLKKQLEEYQLQNINLRADIMIQKKAFPNKLIKDKTFYDLYDMPTYEDLLNQQKEFIEYINEKIDICDGFIDTIRSDLEEISYGGRSCGKQYIANEIMKNEVAKKILEEILSKYKEITGCKE